MLVIVDIFLVCVSTVHFEISHSRCFVIENFASSVNLNCYSNWSWLDQIYGTEQSVLLSFVR